MLLGVLWRGGLTLGGGGEPRWPRPSDAPDVRASVCLGPSGRVRLALLTVGFGAHVHVTETLTSNKIPACQTRLQKQSAIKALTCSWRKLCDSYGGCE